MSQQQAADRVIDLSLYDTDKNEIYLASYHREFGDFFEKPIRLLELGVQRGGSMLLWRDLLPNAEIAGLDLNPVPVPDETGRIHVYQGFQQDPETLDRIAAEVAPDGFEVIIDDASHVGEYTLASFQHLFPRHLKPGGVYVLDDWSAAYRSDWSDGHAYSPPSSDSSTGRIEQLRRHVRASARPLAAKIQERSPELRKRLEALYMKAEGVSLQRRFGSHDYGMAGVAKQLIDACGTGTQYPIDRINVTQSQIFIHRQS
jgi:hypothetical protein